MKQSSINDFNLSISEEEIIQLSQRKPLVHLLNIFSDWLTIILVSYLCLQYFNPLTYCLAIIIIGARMHAFGVLAHDAAHYLFIKNRKWSDIITNITCMYPLFNTVEDYRKSHLKHHAHLNTSDDPDWLAKEEKEEFKAPKTKKEFILTLLSYLIFVQGVRDILWITGLKRARNQNSNQSEVDYVRILFYFLAIVSITYFGIWKHFILFWLIPYATTFFMFMYIRSYSEHFALSYDSILTSTRTIKASFIGKYLFAPHNVGYHLEHHLFPSVPFYHIPKLHDILMMDSNYSSKAKITHGYLQLMNEMAYSFQYNHEECS